MTPSLASTPAKLRAVQLATALVAVLFAVLASVGFSRRQADLRETRVAADNLLRVQDIRVAAVRADSLASQAYLLGGQEPAASRAAFNAQIDAATSGLVTVSEQLTAVDAGALGSVSAKLSTYMGLVEQARANNRQGFPVGAAYQRQANGLLTAEIIPAIREVEQRIRRTVNDRLDQASDDGAWLYLPGLALLGALGAGGMWLARRFRRTANLPILVAGAATLAALVIAGSSLSSTLSEAEDAVGAHLQTADLAAQARAAAFDARSQEALGLINRGNSAANESLWRRSSATVQASLEQVCGPTSGTCAAGTQYAEYMTRHAEMRALDDGGGWDAAVAASVGAPDPSPLTRAFEQFATTSAEITTRGAGETLSGLGGALDGLGVVRFVTFVLGLAAGALTVRGLGQRLAEYR